MTTISTMRTRIISELGVQAKVNIDAEMQERIVFLADYMRKSGIKSYVLGISGGVDSTTAGMLAQRAVSFNKALYNYDCQFIAVRLPYGVQRDESEAQRAIDIIKPDVVQTINIKPATDAMMDSLYGVSLAGGITPAQDFTKGNIKARQRMIAQYAIAGQTKGLVIGTDHAAEAVMGFFTKFGDGGSDINPLAGLTKQQVRHLAGWMGVPLDLVNKPPTADLEDLDPGKLDENAYGVTYDDIGNFLTGQPIPQSVEDVIVAAYLNTAHKRDLPVTPI